MPLIEDILIRFVLAALLGGLIGIEREYHSKSAGFRTMIMIAVGSCFFTIMSALFTSTNPERIASNIVTGIGFIGAGVIFKGDNRINGITTAATIWVVSAVGMGIGMGLYLASTMVSLLIFLVLAVLPYIEGKIDGYSQVRYFTIESKLDDEALHHILDKYKAYNLKARIITMEKNIQTMSITVWTKGNEKNIKAFTRSLWYDDHVISYKV